MQDYIRTLRMLNSTGTSYLDNISYMYYLYDSLGRLTLQGGILLPVLPCLCRTTCSVATTSQVRFILSPTSRLV